MIALAWRLLTGRPTLAWLALACIAVGVAARGAVTGSVGAIESNLATQARELIAADLEVSSARPIDDAVRSAVAAIVPREARSTELRSLTAMAASDTGAALCELRAIGNGWPLAGRLLTEPVDAAAALRKADLVAVVDADLLPRLGVAVGGELRLGTAAFRIAGTIDSEPGAGGSSFRLGPRVYIPLAALASAGLSGEGVRARHMLLVALPDPALAQAAAATLRSALGLPNDQAEGMGSGPSQSPITVRAAVDAAQQGARSAGRAADLLRVVALFALALGALGVAALANGMMRAQAEDLAVLRVLGATQRRAAAVFAVQALLIGALGGLLGGLLGAGLSAAAAAGMDIPPALPDPRDLLIGVLLGATAALTAAALPALALTRMQPLAVLRGEEPAPAPRGAAILVALTAIVLGALAAAYEARSWSIGPGVAAGAAVVALLMAATGRVLLPQLARLRPRGFALRHGLANLARSERRPGALVVALGLAAALGAALLTLRATFDAELAPGRMTERPSFFAIDVQDDQRQGFIDALAVHGLTPNLRPQIRARLRRIDAVDAAAVPIGSTREDELAARFRRREQNLTWASSPGPGETLVAGRWPSVSGECAVQDRWAKTLGVGIGSQLVFDVQGVEVTARITGLRRIDWWTFQPNFFINLHPDTLAGAPAVWLGTIPAMPREQRRSLAIELARSFPNVSLVDVADAATTVRAAIDRAAAGVAAIAAIALLAALAVVAGTAAAGARERRGEAALIRALGGTARTVALAIAAEFLAAALPAAIIGSALGVLGGTLLAGVVLEAQVSRPWLQLVALACILATAAALTALLAARQAWRVPPLAALRDE
jgi:putative ABC transport system permease protein